VSRTRSITRNGTGRRDAPSDGQAWQLRGDCHRQLKDQAKALADYDQALKLNLDNPALYNARAGIHADMGQTEKAIADYTRGIRLRLDDPVPIRQRGALYAGLGRYQGGRRRLQPEREPEARLHGCNLDRGYAYGQLGEFKNAVADFTKVLETQPRATMPWRCAARPISR